MTEYSKCFVNFLIDQFFSRHQAPQCRSRLKIFTKNVFCAINIDEKVALSIILILFSFADTFIWCRRQRRRIKHLSDPGILLHAWHAASSDIAYLDLKIVTFFSKFNTIITKYWYDCWFIKLTLETRVVLSLVLDF